ncbi:MAG: hypothetical protein HKN03_05790 [Acidimicrobiales bacterium]|nr:hypothetical protein [Acidimicrobiales bacterium]
MGAILQPNRDVMDRVPSETAFSPNAAAREPSAHAGVSLSRTSPATHVSSTIAWPLLVGGGLIAGAAWGINARLWMRYITTDPEFSWGGTLFIVIGFAIVGLSQSVAFVARRRISTRWKLTLVRIATFVGLLPIFGAAGALMAPTVLLGALAMSHSDWPKWLRGISGIGATLPVAAVSASVFADFSVLHAMLATIWLIVIYAVVVVAAQFTLAPQLDGWRPPKPLRLVGFAAVLPLLLGAALTLFAGF